MNSVYRQEIRLPLSTSDDRVAAKLVDHSVPGICPGVLDLDDCRVGWRERDSVPAAFLVGARALDHFASTEPVDCRGPDGSVRHFEVRADL